MVSLDDFAAQSEGLATLIEDVRSGRVSHAVLLTGTVGTGKRTLARLLACYFLCTSSTQRPCMQCKGCRRVMNGTHPDLLMPTCSEKERSVKVEHLREIIHALSMHSVEGGERVVLLENAQRMTVQAQNALLKSLEEPDGATRFLLTASGDVGLLPTVRSRCRTARLPLWPTKQVADELIRRGTKPEKAREIAVLSGGSIGTALAMLEDNDLMRVRTLCEETFFSLSSVRDVPEAAVKLRECRDDADALLDVFEQRVREYLLYSMKAGSEPAAVSQTRCHEIWLRAEPVHLEHVLSAVLDARRYRTANVSLQAVVEKLLYTTAEEIN